MNPLSKTNYHLLSILIIILSIFSFTSCKKKKTFDELNAEHVAKKSAIENKLTKNYCYDITKIALGQRFSRIDTIVITKYVTKVEYSGKWAEVRYERAYVRTDGTVKGQINGQEGDFSYWFETNIKTDSIDSKKFDVESMFVKDSDGYYAVHKYGIHDDADEVNRNLKAGRKLAEDNKIMVDGIEVRFRKKSDLGGVDGIYFESDVELTPEQMKAVVRKVKLKYDFVDFSRNGKSYAYYEDGKISYDIIFND